MSRKRFKAAVCTALILSMLFSMTASAADWDLKLDSLAKTYEDYFAIGNIMEPHQIGNAATTAMFTHHYNFVTAENAMKPASLSPAKGTYNFTQADALVNWANSNNIAVHGHTLVWHSQSARWLNMDGSGNALTREQAKANMKEYIDNVAGRYAGKLASWDVVNEAFQTGVGAKPTDWKTALRKEGSDGSPWFRAYANGADVSKGESGADYIYDAFVFARLADPSAILYYNDFNETQPGKREAMALMTEELNVKWKTDTRNTEPDRLLIEGIGMQAHYFTSDVNAAQVEATIQRFIQTGAEISITELDIPHGAWNTYTQRKAEPTKEEEQRQADLYKKLFEVYGKYAENIARVTFWGKIDSQSWRSQGYPSLFDKNNAPKAAYYSIIDAAKTLTPPVKETPEPVVTPPAETPSGEYAITAEETAALNLASDWAQNAITNGLKRGYIPADLRTDYKKIITREEFCRMAVKYVEYYTGKTIDQVLEEKGKSRNPNAFTDTNNPDILAAFALGITDGTGNNTFTPNGQFKRQQAARMITNLCAVLGMDTKSSPPSNFADIGSAATWAVDSIHFCYANEYMIGKTATTFDPLGTYTRQESIRVFDNIG